MAKKRKQVNEFKASYGVDADVPDVESVKQATPPGKPPAGGDKEPHVTGPTSLKPGDRVGKIAGLVNKLSEMSEEELDALHAALSEEEVLTGEDAPLEEGKMKPVEDEDEDEDEDGEDENEDEDKPMPKKGLKGMKEALKVSAADLNLTEDVAAAFTGIEMTEEFKAKATELFEAAVVTKVNERLAESEALIEAEIQRQVEDAVTVIAEQVDTYLTYAADEWMKDNKLAVERGLQVEMAQDFLAGLKVLFEEHYIQVPPAQEDLVEQMADRVEALEARLNEQTAKAAKLQKLVESYERKAIVEAAAVGLSDAQAAKLQAVAENLEYQTPEDFAEKVEHLKESYFPTGGTPAAKASDLDPTPLTEDATKPAHQGTMGAYVAAISKSVTKV